jgi:hypothetical protein
LDSNVVIAAVLAPLLLQSCYNHYCREPERGYSVDVGRGRQSRSSVGQITPGMSIDPPRCPRGLWLGEDLHTYSLPTPRHAAPRSKSLHHHKSVRDLQTWRPLISSWMRNFLKRNTWTRIETSMVRQTTRKSMPSFTTLRTGVVGASSISVGLLRYKYKQALILPEVCIISMTVCAIYIFGGRADITVGAVRLRVRLFRRPGCTVDESSVGIVGSL